MPPESGSPSAPPPGAERRQTLRRSNDRRLVRRDRQLEVARRVSQALFEHRDLDDLLDRVLVTALDVVGAESGSILLARPDQRQLVFHHSVGSRRVPSGTGMPWDKGIAGAVFHSGRPLLVGDAKADPRFFPDIDALTRHVTRDLAALPLHMTRDVIALPMKREQGEPIGVLEILNKREGVLDEDDLALLTVLSAMAACDIERARLYQEAKIAEVAHLLGDIGRDITNLLMPINGGISVLEDELRELFGRLPHPALGQAESAYKVCRDITAMFRRSSRRIKERVTQISDCIEGLKRTPQFAPCQISAVVGAVFEALRWLAERRQVALTAEGLEALPLIQADEPRLFVALYNLIDNALAEVPPGGSVTVSGAEQHQAAGVLLSVADTGRGMPPEVQASLFTLHAKSRKAGGTGLGTKIVKDVIDAHRGRIVVRSEEGVGTTFQIALPREPV